jgi:hypothetical protein
MVLRVNQYVSLVEAAAIERNKNPCKLREDQLFYKKGGGISIFALKRRKSERETASPG